MSQKDQKINKKVTKVKIYLLKNIINRHRENAQAKHREKSRKYQERQEMHIKKGQEIGRGQEE